MGRPQLARSRRKGLVGFGGRFDRHVLTALGDLADAQRRSTILNQTNADSPNDRLWNVRARAGTCHDQHQVHPRNSVGRSGGGKPAYHIVTPLRLH